MAAAASSHCESVRLTMATLAPASARASAIMRPSPFEPPVTSALRPSRRNLSSTVLFTMSPSSSPQALPVHYLSAIDVDRLPRHVGGAVGGKEDDHVGDAFWRLPPPERADGLDLP